MYDAAECLYLIVKLACEDENTALVDSINEVGDADGDGLLEFQDAFAGMMQSYQTNSAQKQPDHVDPLALRLHECQHRQFFGASFQVVPRLRLSGRPGQLCSSRAQVGTGKGGQVVADMMTFSQDNHDYFDTLKLDIPGASGLPRGYRTDAADLLGRPDEVRRHRAFRLERPRIQLHSARRQYINDPYAGDSSGLRAGQWYDFSGT